MNNSLLNAILTIKKLSSNEDVIAKLVYYRPPTSSIILHYFLVYAHLVYESFHYKYVNFEKKLKVAILKLVQIF